MTLWFRRGARYTSIGVATFIIDLALLFFLIDTLNLNILFSTGLAFIGALSLNYFFSRKYVFPNSNRGHAQGYLYFILFALTGMALTVALMWTLISFTAWHYATSRVLIAITVGFGNYYANLFLNFKVSGVYLDKKKPQQGRGF